MLQHPHTQMKNTHALIGPEFLFWPNIKPGYHRPQLSMLAKRTGLVLRRSTRLSVRLYASRVSPLEDSVSESLKKERIGTVSWTKTSGPELKLSGSNNNKNSQFCATCGVLLQSEHPEKPGYVERKVVESRGGTRRQSHKRHSGLGDSSKLLQILSAEDKQLLMNIPEAAAEPVAELQAVFDESVAGKAEEHRADEHACLRCHGALNHHIKFEKSLQEMPALQEMFQHESWKLRNSTIMYCVSTTDFPFSLNLGLFNEIQTPEKVFLVFNKADTMFGTEAAAKNAKRYFLQAVNAFLLKAYKAGSLRRKMQLKESQIILTSSVSNWGLAEIHTQLLHNKKLFFFGEPNVGKSSLVQTLCNQKHGTAHHLPGTTQDALVYKSKYGTVVDLPGFRPEALDAQSFLLDFWSKYLNKKPSKNTTQKSRKSYQERNKLLSTQYHSVVGTKCYSFGGLVYLSGTENTILQIKSRVPDCGRVFRSVDRALEFYSGESPHAVKEKIVDIGKFCPGGTPDLARYILPPFFGEMELIVKSFGRIEVTPTSGAAKFESREQFVQDMWQNCSVEVFAPKNLPLLARVAMDYYLLDTMRYEAVKKVVKKKFDPKKSRLGNFYESKPVFDRKPRPFYKDLPVYTKLVEVPPGVENAREWAFSQVRHQLEAHRSIFEAESEESLSWFDKRYPEVEQMCEDDKRKEMLRCYLQESWPV